MGCHHIRDFGGRSAEPDSQIKTGQREYQSLCPASGRLNKSPSATSSCARRVSHWVCIVNLCLLVLQAQGENTRPLILCGTLMSTPSNGGAAGAPSVAAKPSSSLGGARTNRSNSISGWAAVAAPCRRSSRGWPPLSTQLRRGGVTWSAA